MSLLVQLGEVKGAAMAIWLSKLLFMLSVLLMPLAMSAAPAAAAAAPGQASAHSAPAMEHCPDPAPAQDVEPGIAACSMACSAALPAIGHRAPGPRLVSQPPQDPRAIKMPAGILLETATPPPRFA